MTDRVRATEAMTTQQTIADGPPDDEWAKLVCKVGQRQHCCRYLAMARGGWSCLKHTPLKDRMDQRAAAGTLLAEGDRFSLQE